MSASKKRRRRKNENAASQRCALCLPLLKLAARNACFRAVLHRFQSTPCNSDQRSQSLAQRAAVLHNCRCAVCSGWQCQLQPQPEPQPTSTPPLAVAQFAARNNQVQVQLPSRTRRSRFTFRLLTKQSRKSLPAKLATVDRNERRAACELLLRRQHQYACAYNYCRLRQLLNPEHECAHFAAHPEEHGQLFVDNDHNRCEAIIELPSVPSPATV